MGGPTDAFNYLLSKQISPKDLKAIKRNKIIAKIVGIILAGIVFSLIVAALVIGIICFIFAFHILEEMII